MRMMGLNDDTAWATSTFKAQEDQSLDGETYHAREDFSALAFAHEGFLAGDSIEFV